MNNAPTMPLGLAKKLLLVFAAFFVALAAIGHNRDAAAAAQDTEREVHKPGGRVVAPTLIRETKPAYPDSDKKIVESLHPDLDKAALDAAAQWLFNPGTRDGTPVDVLVTIAMAFTLKD